MSTSSNPVIIVTGSSSGIGAEVARLAVESINNKDTFGRIYSAVEK